MTKIISVAFGDLNTPKAETKHELLSIKWPLSYRKFQGDTTLSITTLSITPLRIMTLSIKDLFVTTLVDSQQK